MRTERRQADHLLRTLVERTPEEVHTLVRSRLQDSEQLHDGRRVREHRANAHRADLKRQQSAGIEQHAWHGQRLLRARPVAPRPRWRHECWGGCYIQVWSESWTNTEYSLETRNTSHEEARRDYQIGERRRNLMQLQVRRYRIQNAPESGYESSRWFCSSTRMSPPLLSKQSPTGWFKLCSMLPRPPNEASRCSAKNVMPSTANEPTSTRPERWRSLRSCPRAFCSRGSGGLSTHVCSRCSLQCSQWWQYSMLCLCAEWRLPPLCAIDAVNCAVGSLNSKCGMTSSAKLLRLAASRGGGGRDR